MGWREEIIQKPRVVYPARKGEMRREGGVASHLSYTIACTSQVSNSHFPTVMGKGTTSLSIYFLSFFAGLGFGQISYHCLSYLWPGSW